MAYVYMKGPQHLTIKEEIKTVKDVGLVLLVGWSLFDDLYTTLCYWNELGSDGRYICGLHALPAQEK